ncbi:uncharacterized protein DS421_18g609990 [Arachis hypogaea]|nr:uncharacterized protein DS421_18g609990 [Arachis hypogaea]
MDGRPSTSMKLRKRSRFSHRTGTRRPSNSFLKRSIAGFRGGKQTCSRAGQHTLIHATTSAIPYMQCVANWIDDLDRAHRKWRSTDQSKQAIAPCKLGDV